jgi:hypothetical protein
VIVYKFLMFFLVLVGFWCSDFRSSDLLPLRQMYFKVVKDTIKTIYKTTKVRHPNTICFQARMATTGTASCQNSARTFSISWIVSTHQEFHFECWSTNTRSSSQMKWWVIYLLLSDLWIQCEIYDEIMCWWYGIPKVKLHNTLLQSF